MILLLYKGVKTVEQQWGKKRIFKLQSRYALNIYYYDVLELLIHNYQLQVT